MYKSKVEEFDLEFDDGTAGASDQVNQERTKKHTLDSDEEDSGDDERYNVLPDDDIEGEEEGVSGIQDEIKITPFNMKEEMEEGHFDKEGHFQWDKDKEIKDNWLDNIDWIKVKTNKKYINKTNTGLADSSDSDGEDSKTKTFNELQTYKEILALMLPGETVKKALQRLGGKNSKISSVERWRRKKAGIVDENSALVTKLTELTNNILTELGNMDVYEESYELIKKKIKRKLTAGGTSTADDGLDMYSDDFEHKEKKIKLDSDFDNKDDDQEESLEPPKLQWEYKWKQEDDKIHGPYTSEQMQKWVEDNYFKEGVFVRKCNAEDSKFYSSNRIDFDLYI